MNIRSCLQQYIVRLLLANCHAEIKDSYNYPILLVPEAGKANEGMSCEYIWKIQTTPCLKKNCASVIFE